MITKEKNILKSLIIILVIIIITILLKYTLAKYMSMLGNQGNADIARWVFKVNGNDTQTTNVANFAITRTDKDNDSVALNTLASGTEGEFEIEIDATGTETMLQYLIDITLIKKPENLKFYLKNGNTDEKIFLETEDNHLKTKGFISLNDTKVRNEKVYWIWELETGNNADDIRINDKKDIECIGETMEMQISVTGMQSLGPGDVEMLNGTMAKYDFSEVSWYNINEGVLSGYNTNGFIAVPHNIVYGNNYLEFNATNKSYVNLGQINSKEQTLEVTFSTYKIDKSLEQEYILGNVQSGGGGIYIYNNNNIRGTYWIKEIGYKGITSDENLVKNQIYHVVFTYDGKKEVLYIDGIKQGNYPIEGEILVPNNNTIMALGTNPSGNSSETSYFDGKIYSVTIYDRALTEEEVSHNAQIALNQVNNN